MNQAISLKDFSKRFNEELSDSTSQGEVSLSVKVLKII